MPHCVLYFKQQKAEKSWRTTSQYLTLSLPSVINLLVDPIPNSPNWRHKNCQGVKGLIAKTTKIFFLHFLTSEISVRNWICFHWFLFFINLTISVLLMYQYCKEKWNLDNDLPDHPHTDVTFWSLMHPCCRILYRKSHLSPLDVALEPRTHQYHMLIIHKILISLLNT